jgi:hypothetical protein
MYCALLGGGAHRTPPPLRKETLLPMLIPPPTTRKWIIPSFLPRVMLPSIGSHSQLHPEIHGCTVWGWQEEGGGSIVMNGDVCTV